MNTIMAILGAVAGIIFFLFGVFFWLSRITPVDRDEDGAQSDRETDLVIDASRPAPLEVERRHVKAGTAWGIEQ